MQRCLIILLMCWGIAYAGPEDSRVARADRWFGECNIDALEALGRHFDVLTPDDVSTEDAYLSLFLSYRRAAFYLQTDNAKAARRVLARGQKQAKIYAQRFSEDEEFHVLSAGVLGLRILQSPFKALWLAPRAEKSIERALQIDPDNPRALMMQGVGELQASAFLLGSRDQAQHLLDKGLTAAEQEPESYWGHIDLLLWAGQLAEESEDPALARQLFSKIEQRSPENCWLARQRQGKVYRASETPQKSAEKE